MDGKNGKKVALILEEKLMQRINTYRRNHPDMPNLSESIRKLLWEALDTFHPEVPDDFFDEEGEEDEQTSN